MKVVCACEYSGIVRTAFAKRGHDAVSCDLLPGEIYLFNESKGRHFQGNIFTLLEKQKALPFRTRSRSA